MNDNTLFDTGNTNNNNNINNNEIYTEIDDAPIVPSQPGRNDFNSMNNKRNNPLFQIDN